MKIISLFRDRLGLIALLAWEAFWVGCYIVYNVFYINEKPQGITGVSIVDTCVSMFFVLMCIAPVFCVIEYCNSR